MKFRREKLRSEFNKLTGASDKLLEALHARILAEFTDLRDLVDRVLEALSLASLHTTP